MLRTQTDLSAVYSYGVMIRSEELVAEYNYSRIYLGRYDHVLITSEIRNTKSYNLNAARDGGFSLEAERGPNSPG